MDARGRAAQLRALVGRVPWAPSLRGLLPMAAAVGVATGLAVAAFDGFVADVVFDRVVDLPLGVVALCPFAGLAIASLLLRGVFHQGDGATTDAYVRAYHEAGGRVRLADLPGRLSAAAATLGSGAALGFEGPSILIGSTIGSTVERRLPRRVGPDHAKVLMVAGAAAGVAAIFKAPLTGVVFALEVPYRQDLARRALLPALVAASASYVVFAALAGTEPILLSRGSAPFDVADIGGALLLGLACGLLARIGARTVLWAKRLAVPAPVRIGGAGAGLAALVVLSYSLFDDTLSLGSGYRAIDWAAVPGRSFGLLVALFAIRAGATWLAVAGGGVGGLFVPLVVQGAVTGAVVQSVVDVPNPTLFPTIGIAAFLGAGYRTPLAGVAFVAEATGRPGFVVPALVAAAVAQLTMGRWSFSPYQQTERLGHLERRLAMRVGDVLSPVPETIGPGATIGSFVQQATTGRGHRWLPVVQDGRFLGSVGLRDAGAVARDDWDVVVVGDVMQPGTTVGPDVPVVVAAETMHRQHLDQVAVVEAGELLGVFTTRDLTKLDQLLEVIEPDDPTSDS